MPVDEQTIAAMIREAMPDADVSVTDTVGDRNHYAVRVVSAAFAGLPRVRQHQMVYAALQGKAGGDIHAISVQTLAPDA